jgi:hypothetical protein
VTFRLVGRFIVVCTGVLAFVSGNDGGGGGRGGGIALEGREDHVLHDVFESLTASSV